MTDYNDVDVIEGDDYKFDKITRDDDVLLNVREELCGHCRRRRCLRDRGGGILRILQPLLDIIKSFLRLHMYKVLPLWRLIGDDVVPVIVLKIMIVPLSVKTGMMTECLLRIFLNIPCTAQVPVAYVDSQGKRGHLPLQKDFLV